MSKQCQAETQAGAPCKTPAQAGKEWCIFHDPELAAQRQRARSEGGRNRSRKAAVLPEDTPDFPLQTIAEVQVFLVGAINKTLRGEVDSRIANACGYLTNLLLKSLEASEFAEQIALLRARIEQIEAVRTGRGGPNVAVSPLPMLARTRPAAQAGGCPLDEAPPA